MTRRHMLKAVLLVALVVLVGWLVPSWETVLTRPIGQWQHVRIQAVTPAPELAEPPAPFRVAAQPPASPPADSSLQHVTAQDEHEGQLEAPERASERAPVDVARVKAELNDLLTVGDRLVQAGIRLPQLVARWSVADIEALVAKGLGMVVAETDGQFYQVIADEGGVLAAQDFQLLRIQEREKLSNRGVYLNRERHGGGWRDTAVRPVFAKLEQRLQVHSPSQTPPVLLFFPTGAFDAYLARKQLGALAQLGIDPYEPEFGKTQAVTMGTIVLAQRRPVYLIHQVQYGKTVWTWDDPEAALVEQKV